MSRSNKRGISMGHIETGPSAFWYFVTLSREYPRGCLQFVIVVFPDHTHLLFLIEAENIRISSKVHT